MHISPKQQHVRAEVALTGRRRTNDAPNSLKFLANIEGVEDIPGHIRSSNGIRWRVA